MDLFFALGDDVEGAVFPEGHVEFYLVAGDYAFVIEFHVLAVEVSLHAERKAVAVDLAVLNLRFTRLANQQAGKC
jgi:hypothetical protein